jgi:hypothetical protein
MLSQRARIILDTLLPAGVHPTLGYGIFDAGFDAFLSDFERIALPSWRWGFRSALFVATWIAPLLIHRLPPLTLYNRRTRERALAAMETSRIYFLRQMMALLKTIVCFRYGADRDVRDVIGYPIQRDDPRRYRNDLRR